MSVIRNICFTWNNYDDGVLDRINYLGWSYIIYGKEVGTNGTRHLQGYAEFDKSQRFSSLCKKWSGAHIEIRKGSQQQAIDYCKKDGNFIEFGIRKEQGSRNDLESTRLQVIEGGMRAIVGWASYQQIKVGEVCLKYLEECRDWKMETLWVWGETGLGKSKLARECLGNDIYCKNDGSKWWEGYDGHTDVIIDDFRDSWWSLTEMLSLLDRYEKRVECKGGSRQFRARRVIVTSCYSPKDCYKGCGEDIKQLLRRVDDVVHLVADVAEVKGVILEPLDILL